VLPLQQHRPPYMKELTGHLVELFGADLLTQIQIPPRGDDQDAARRQLAGTLTAAAGRDREPLEQLRARFIRRLHRVSDDFAATAGLRVTEAALALVPRPDGVWAWGHREPTKPRRRWWRRRRRDDAH
jgi:hypothetical protein